MGDESGSEVLFLFFIDFYDELVDVVCEGCWWEFVKFEGFVDLEVCKVIFDLNVVEMFVVFYLYFGLDVDCWKDFYVMLLGLCYIVIVFWLCGVIVIGVELLGEVGVVVWW